MRLHTLHITAFGPFGGTQEIDFDALSSAGLFLLHGPTGAGKTSVLDAVCYALYGAVPGARQSAAGQGQSLRSDHAEPGTRTEVRLELTVAGRRLELTRQPPFARPKKRGTGFTTEKAQSWLREYDAVAGEWKDLSRSHQEIGEEVTQLLGMSKDQFCQVVLLPQGDFARFLRADAEARGKLLGRLFDTRRFAAVEQRLAEDRRAAEKQVTAGDAELLAEAHRMQQAAGDVVETAPVDAVPGDPGVAEAVLGWAAVARSTAREHFTHAHLALGAAETARVAAQRDLAEAQETDRLQRRFAQAEARAAALAAQEEEQRAVRERMERGRKAETVAPALSLRDAAEAEHAAALREEAHTRRELREAPDTGEGAVDSGLAEAGPGALAEAARRVAQELGGLDAARRAERRLGGVARERADLDREERADTELLDEAEQWLARWDTRRGALQAEVDAAQEAATRAEHLGGQLEPALQQARAARERDRLTAQADTARDDALAAREKSAHAREHWLALKEQRLLGIAAELAEELTDGAPCAVCGATEHPAPQRRSAGHVDRAAEEAALAAYRAAEDRVADAERRAAAVREALAAAKAAAGDAPAEQLAEAARALQDRHAEARDLASGLHAAREALARAESEHGRRLIARQDAATRTAARSSLRDALDREQAGLERELTQARGAAASVEARAAQLERLVELLGTAAEAARAVEDTAQRLKDADARLADAAFKAGFDTPQEAAAARLDDVHHRELQHRLDAWQSETAAVRAVLAEEDTAAAARRPAADVAAAHATAEAADARVRAAGSGRDAAQRRCTELDRLSRRAATEARRLGPLRATYNRVARLAALAAGTSADNERKMRLESYVLAARLEQVAAAATARLSRMSAGRYTLVHSDSTAGRGRSGLGLHVVDAWTGRERDTATLSGGETFFASLALALGLADVVTDEAGGVRLDTLFIDEGFGSLDDQTLDDVLDVLDSLRERDRSVGIVSHVGDLRRRVHAQLEVVKGRDGSVVRQRGAETG
ncbi:AAA family ATPase [Streptomyces sp. VRA16 Mangrove soil]|uniref:AAA family ATPase n=1 Tax=Streptomyces sp. VRA16 Mangrove soil TaxID=2817434 RepID=UPI001A9E1E94|nr:SMC family ATPase [Streptomyces sp. VRA16 Mangrove soil]MBO1332542.1 SMC family ATPase [Streptomyces sp. VRA16 Mangrove soil]